MADCQERESNWHDHKRYSLLSFSMSRWAFVGFFNHRKSVEELTDVWTDVWMKAATTADTSQEQAQAYCIRGGSLNAE